MYKLKKIFYKFIFTIFLLFLFIFVSAKSYSNAMSKSISNKFLRLHVVANSDSTEDQILKYQIRDAVLEYMEQTLKDAKSKEEALELLNNSKENIEKIAKKIAFDNNFNYDITVSIGNFYFPTKEYSNFILPNGFYDALQIKIGKAAGQNWWCVMFPSLCITEQSCNFTNSSEEFLQENLSNEEFKVLYNNPENQQLKIKFKLIELFENM